MHDDAAAGPGRLGILAATAIASILQAKFLPSQDLLSPPDEVTDFSTDVSQVSPASTPPPMIDSAFRRSLMILRCILVLHATTTLACALEHFYRHRLSPAFSTHVIVSIHCRATTARPPRCSASHELEAFVAIG